jgi:hypothetical protein
MRKWKGDPLMTAQDLSRKSGEYRRRAFVAEVEALKKESACSATALDAYAERALNGGLKPKTAEEREAEADKAGKAARDRVLILAGYDPLLVAREGRPPRKNALSTAGSARTSAPEPHAPGYGAALSRASTPASTNPSPSIHPVVPAEIRARGNAAYETAYTRAYALNPPLGDPTASPLAAPNPTLGDPTASLPSGCQWDVERWWRYVTEPESGYWMRHFLCCANQERGILIPCYGDIRRVSKTRCVLQRRRVCWSDVCASKWVSCRGWRTVEVLCARCKRCGGTDSLTVLPLWSTFPRKLKTCKPCVGICT